MGVLNNLKQPGQIQRLEAISFSGIITTESAVLESASSSPLNAITSPFLNKSCHLAIKFSDFPALLEPAACSMFYAIIFPVLSISCHLFFKAVGGPVTLEAERRVI